MAPDAWSDQRLDDLAQQVRVVAALSTMVAAHEAKIDGLGDDIASLRQMQEKAWADFQRMLAAFDAACEKKVDRLETAIDKQGKKIDEQAKARTFGPMAIATIIAAVIGANGAIIAALAGYLHP